MELNIDRKDKKYLFLFLISFFIQQTVVIFGVNISISDLLVVILFLNLILLKNKSINVYHLVFLFSIISIYLFNGCLLIPQIYGIEIVFLKILSEISKIILLFIFFEIGVYLKNEKYINKFIKYYSYSALVITAISILITIFNFESFYDEIYMVKGRLNGLMDDPNYFAIVELSAIPFFINSKKSFKLLYIALLVFGIILSGSKTGFICLMIYFIYKIIKYLLYKNTSIYKKIYYVLFLFFLIFIIWFNFYDIIRLLNKYIPISSRIIDLFDNFNSAFNDNGSSRIAAWSNGINLIKRFPIFGVGKGNNSVMSKLLYSNGTIAHNTYIQIFADWGILLSSIFIIYLIYKYIKLDTRKYNIEQEILMIFLLGSLGFSLDNSRMMWLIIGSYLFYK